MQVKIKNPIIPGFNPDPNVLRVGTDYYIAVSSFEWLPGIRVYHSTDLVNWEFANDILTTQVDLRGNPDGGSIWAPQISYADQQFYCIYTDVKNAHGPFKDCHNYLITAPTIAGPWSTPIYLNSSGFDPALFHDPQTGRKWLVNEIWDYRMTTSNKSAGIVLQEYDLEQQQLVGPVQKIFAGTERAKTEAPQLYFHQGYYYLLTAEGGTGKNHAVTVCRARQITGPYELAPNSPILTASDKPTVPLQCTGHASLVQATTDHWYIVYLTTRPLAGEYHILGRETAIQEVRWTTDHWLETTIVGNGPELTPQITVERPVKQRLDLDFHAHFDQSTLQPQWNTNRILADSSWVQLRPAEGCLRLQSGESPMTTFDHHLLAIRQNSFNFRVTTALDYHPRTFNELAGLLLYLNNQKFLYFYVTHDETAQRCLRMMQVDRDQYHLFDKIVTIPDGLIELRFDVAGLQATAGYRVKGTASWQLFADKLPLEFLSGGFTGNFIGIGVHDMDQKCGSYADFYRFDYETNGQQ